MNRIRLVGKDEATGDVAAIYEVLQQEFNKIPNLFATVAHHPQAMKPLLEFFDSLYNQSDLDPRLLEFVVIRIAYGYQSHYCLTFHKAFALERGLTNDEIKAMGDPSTWGRFPDNERALLELIDEYAKDPLAIPDELFERMREHYTESQIVNLILLMGLATLFGLTANALHIPIDSFVGATPPATS